MMYVIIEHFRNSLFAITSLFVTNRDGIPLNFERTTAVYDSVLHGNKGRARRRWVMPVDSKIIRSE